MSERIFGDREKALEAAYFRNQDAKLLEKLRQRDNFDEIAVALGEKLQVDDPDLLARTRRFGITRATAPAFFIAPLVQVAWAEGNVSKEEHRAVLRLAHERGIEPGSPAHEQLEEWLRSRPDDAFFDTAVEVLKAAFSVLPVNEREERIKAIVRACQEVAEASAGFLRLFGLTDGVSPEEALTLDDITRALRKHD